MGGFNYALEPKRDILFIDVKSFMLLSNASLVD